VLDSPVYSLVESAKVAGVDPVAYLVEVATRVRRIQALCSYRAISRPCGNLALSGHASGRAAARHELWPARPLPGVAPWLGIVATQNA
jgi:hypothetical protein